MSMNDIPSIESKRGRTRRALLAAARYLVSERGHEKISIQDITDRADVALGTFYNYFDTKPAIFAAVLEEMRAEFQAQLDEVRKPLKDPAMMVAVTLAWCFEHAADNEEWKRFVTYSGLDGEHFLHQDPEQCLADIKRGAAAGRFKVDDVAFTQGLILGIVKHVNREIAAGNLGRKAMVETTRHILRMLGLPDPVTRALVQAPRPPASAPKHEASPAIELQATPIAKLL